MNKSSLAFWGLLGYSILTGKKRLTKVLVSLLVVTMVACAIVLVMGIYYGYIKSADTGIGLHSEQYQSYLLKQQELKLEEERIQLAREAEKRAEEERKLKEKGERIEAKQKEVTSAFTQYFTGKSFHSTGWMSSRENKLSEFWRVSFLNDHQIRFEVQECSAFHNLTDEDWRTVAVAPYQLEYELKEDMLREDGFQGKTILKCDGFEGEIMVYNYYRSPVKFCDSFSMSKGDKKLYFYKDR